MKNHVNGFHCPCDIFTCGESGHGHNFHFNALSAHNNALKYFSLLFVGRKAIEIFMNYIDEIFERLNLQQIREFLLFGAECTHISNQSYYERTEIAQKNITNIIQKKFPAASEYEETIGHIYEYAAIEKDIYMEIGLRCGMILAIQFLTDFHKN